MRTNLIARERALNSPEMVQNMVCSKGDTVNESNSADNTHFTKNIKHLLENSLL